MARMLGKTPDDHDTAYFGYCCGVHRRAGIKKKKGRRAARSIERRLWCRDPESA